MATVITFPTERCAERGAEAADRSAGSATIIILPVIRIERHDTPLRGPETTSATGRKRRRRSPRS